MRRLSRSSGDPVEAFAGAACVLSGLALLSLMLALANGHAPWLQKLLSPLAHAGPPLVALAGQGAILIGLWLLWRVAHRGR